MTSDQVALIRTWLEMWRERLLQDGAVEEVAPFIADLTAFRAMLLAERIDETRVSPRGYGYRVERETRDGITTGRITTWWEDADGNRADVQVSPLGPWREEQ